MYPALGSQPEISAHAVRVPDSPPGGSGLICCPWGCEAWVCLCGVHGLCRASLSCCWNSESCGPRLRLVLQPAL